MRLVIISDTHTYHEGIKKIPEGDILVHCGDNTIYGEIWEMKGFLRWFAEQPYDHKIFINGNHEVMVSRLGNLTRVIVNDEFKNSGITYLENEAVEIKGLKFYGSPYTPEFFPENWAYQLKKKDAEDMWSMIPEDTDVLITHGPPHGILDRTAPIGQYGANAGCPELLKVIQKINPKLHCFGHIHNRYGFLKRANPKYNTLFVNAATCDSRYMPVNRPIVVDTAGWKVV